MKSVKANLAVITLLAVFLLCGAMNVFDSWEMTQSQQVALVILLIAATLWISEIIPLFVTSFVILALAVTWLQSVMLANQMQVTQSVFLASFFSDIILLFLGGFVLSAALHKYGIDQELAQWVIAKTGSSTPKLIMGIMGITAFLSMWLSNTATAAMMLALCLPIVRALPEGDRYRKAILLAVPFSANVGGLGTPIGTPPNALAIQYMKQLDIAPSFGGWMVIGIPMVAVMLAIAWLILVLLYRGSSQEIVLDRPQQPTKQSPRRYLVIGITLLTALGWLTSTWHPYSSGTVALLPVLVFFGGRILTAQDFRNLSWDVLMVMGGGLCLGKVIAVSTLADWIIGSVPTEELGPVLMIVMFGMVACVMSCVMSNTATANLIMPMIIGLGAEIVSPLMLAVAFCCSMAMALPISTPPNAITFSSGQIAVKDMMKPGLALTAIGAVLTFTFGYWWWGVVGLR